MSQMFHQTRNASTSKTSDTSSYITDESERISEKINRPEDSCRLTFQLICEMLQQGNID